MRIAFDLDGVLHDWHGPVWAKYFRNEYDDYYDFWKNRFRDVDEERWPPIINDKEVYSASASAEVVSMLHRLSRQYLIYYITLRPRTLHRLTQVWLTRNGFPDASQLIFVDESKVGICKKLNIQLVIEDRIEIMNDLADNDIRILGIKQPWNEDEIGNFEHVESILKVEREISRIDAARRVHRRRNGNE